MLRPVFALLLLAVLPCAGTARPAEEGVPEIRRPPGSPQPVGQWHTLRVVPEACSRIHGRFTGNAARPYEVEVVRTHARCQARARLQDVSQIRPDAAAGWLLNDIVRVPSAACGRQEAALFVWRHPGNATPPKLDAQGRSRVHLNAQTRTRIAPPANLPRYVIDLHLRGQPCG